MLLKKIQSLSYFSYYTLVNLFKSPILDGIEVSYIIDNKKDEQGVEYKDLSTLGSTYYLFRGLLSSIIDWPVFVDIKETIENQADEADYSDEADEKITRLSINKLREMSFLNKVAYRVGMIFKPIILDAIERSNRLNNIEPKARIQYKDLSTLESTYYLFNGLVTSIMHEPIYLDIFDDIKNTITNQTDEADEKIKKLSINKLGKMSFLNKVAYRVGMIFKPTILNGIHVFSTIVDKTWLTKSSLSSQFNSLTILQKAKYFFYGLGGVIISFPTNSMYSQLHHQTGRNAFLQMTTLNKLSFSLVDDVLCLANDPIPGPFNNHINNFQATTLLKKIGCFFTGLILYMTLLSLEPLTPLIKLVFNFMALAIAHIKSLFNSVKNLPTSTSALNLLADKNISEEQFDHLISLCSIPDFNALSEEIYRCYQNNERNRIFENISRINKIIETIIKLDRLNTVPKNNGWDASSNFLSTHIRYIFKFMYYDSQKNNNTQWDFIKYLELICKNDCWYSNMSYSDFPLSYQMYKKDIHIAKFISSFSIDKEVLDACINYKEGKEYSLTKEQFKEIQALFTDKDIYPDSAPDSFVPKTWENEQNTACTEQDSTNLDHSVENILYSQTTNATRKNLPNNSEKKHSN